MEQNLDKLRRLGRIAITLVWVVEAILLVTLVISVLAYASFSISTPSGGTTNLLFTGLSSLVGTLGLMVLLFLVLRLLRSLRTARTPFCPENVRRLKHIAWLLFGVAALQFLTDLVVNFIMVDRMTPTTSLAFASYATQAVAFRFAFSYTPFLLAVLGLMVLCLALSFEYGALLQRESDETL